MKYPNIHTIIVQSSAGLKGCLAEGKKPPVQCVEVKNYTIPDGAGGLEHYVKNALSGGTKRGKKEVPLQRSKSTVIYVVRRIKWLNHISAVKVSGSGSHGLVLTVAIERCLLTLTVNIISLSPNQILALTVAGCLQA